jgi:hypothetical protein
LFGFCEPLELVVFDLEQETQQVLGGSNFTNEKNTKSEHTQTNETKAQPHNNIRKINSMNTKTNTNQTKTPEQRKTNAKHNNAKTRKILTNAHTQRNKHKPLFVIARGGTSTCLSWPRAINPTELV